MGQWVIKKSHVGTVDRYVRPSRTTASVPIGSMPIGDGAYVPKSLAESNHKKKKPPKIKVSAATKAKTRRMLEKERREKQRQEKDLRRGSKKKQSEVSGYSKPKMKPHRPPSKEDLARRALRNSNPSSKPLTDEELSRRILALRKHLS